MEFETYFLLSAFIAVFEEIKILNQALHKKTPNYRDCKELVDFVKQKFNGSQVLTNCGIGQLQKQRS